MNMKVRAWNGNEDGCTQGVAMCIGDVSQKNQQKIEIARAKCKIDCECVCVFGKPFFYSQTSCIQRMFANDTTRHERINNKNLFAITTFLSIFRPHVIGFDGNVASTFTFVVCVLKIYFEIFFFFFSILLLYRNLFCTYCPMDSPLNADKHIPLITDLFQCVHMCIRIMV